MIIRNIDKPNGLVNGTRVILEGIIRGFLKVRKADDENNESFFIPKTTFRKSEAGYTHIREQFPVRVFFAMTIDKSQGQTLQKCGLYLPTPIFSHGQLYVAMSRVKNFNSISILDENQQSLRDRHPSLKGKQNVYVKNVVHFRKDMKNPRICFCLEN